MRKAIRERFKNIEAKRQAPVIPVLLIVQAHETKDEVAKRQGFDLSSNAPRLIINHPA